MASHASLVHPATPPSIGQLYTTEEVATMLRVSRRVVQAWIYAGHLGAIRYGRLVRIREADLVAFGEEVARPTPMTDTAEE